MSPFLLNKDRHAQEQLMFIIRSHAFHFAALLPTKLNSTKCLPSKAVSAEVDTYTENIN